MNTLKITLKQHTPLIHFQHAQEDATLRATEVKPKLDKFILTKLGGDDYKKGIDEAKKKGWLVGKGEHPALDYKMRITPSGECTKNVFSSFPPSSKNDPERICNIQQTLSEDVGYVGDTQYFADNMNIGIDRNKLKQIRLGVKHDKVTITVICMIEGLKKEIEKYKDDFFATQNFGSRQSKGFGCFLPENMKDKKIIEVLNQDNEVTGVFKISDSQQPLQEINHLYSLLKRGKTYGGYEKSLLWKYFCKNQPLRWEKWKIKNHIKDNDISLFSKLKYDKKRNSNHRIEDCERAQNAKYIRALLGLSEFYEFTTFGGFNDKLKVTVKDSLFYNGTTKKDAIDRFKSPIRFIVNGNSVFLVTYKIPRLLAEWQDEQKQYQTRKFKFTVEAMNTNKTFELEIPKTFDVSNFVENTNMAGKNLKVTSL
ncbi:MAG: hypothetical protein LBC89_05320 [Bacteroidales bacterium]|jgi:hypothetical protein|nr:hypothetical protein [Bacteroidales bacterium]